MDHPFDPALPLDVEISFESPHVLLYRLWTRLPDQGPAGAERGVPVFLSGLRRDLSPGPRLAPDPVIP